MSLSLSSIASNAERSRSQSFFKFMCFVDPSSESGPPSGFKRIFVKQEVGDAILNPPLNGYCSGISARTDRRTSRGIMLNAEHVSTWIPVISAESMQPVEYNGQSCFLLTCESSGVKTTFIEVG